MPTEFHSGLQAFTTVRASPKMTTGHADLDSLLGGGIKPGCFYLFYGDRKSGVDRVIHQALVNCLLPTARFGFTGKAVYANCGNYREEKTMLDAQLLTFLLKQAKLDPMQSLEDIYVVCAFSDDQQEQSITDIENLLSSDDAIKLVVVHNIAKLFTSETRRTNQLFGQRIQKLQQVVQKLWRACAQRNVAFVASCRPRITRRGRIPLPEGGKYLRHTATVIVYLRKRSERADFVSAYLRKHPNRPPRKVDFRFNIGHGSLGGRTTPFRVRLQDMMNRLKGRYREVLLDASERATLDSLLQMWNLTQGSMSYATVPTVLDAMMLTAVIDNRKGIDNLSTQVESVNANLREIQKQIERRDRT